MNTIQKLAFILTMCFSVTLTGCDKIPFLSQFFPSAASQKPAAQQTAVVSPSVPAAPSNNAVLAPNVLAKVGNWTLTVDEFNEKLKALKEVLPDYDASDPEAKKTILEELIRQELLIQDAEKSGLAQKKDIADAVEEFRRTLIVREVAGKMTEGMATTDQEAQDYYNQNKSSLVNPGEWHLREIVVPTQDEAREIQIEVLKGADFAGTAKTRSKSADAPQGGDLGFVKEFKFPEIEKAVATLNVGDVSSVFKGPEGYYIVKLEEKKGGEPLSFEATKEEIKTGLTLMKQQQKILSYLDDLKAKANVQVNENLLK